MNDVWMMQNDRRQGSSGMAPPRGRGGRSYSPRVYGGAFHAVPHQQPRRAPRFERLQRGGLAIDPYEEYPRKNYFNRFKYEYTAQGPDKSKGYSDDQFLSKLVKQFIKGEDDLNRLDSSFQLKEYLKDPRNSSSVLHSGDNLLISLQNVLYDSNSTTIKNEASSCIGLIGGLMSYQAKRFIHWVFTKVNSCSSDATKEYFLNAFRHALLYDLSMTNNQGSIQFGEAVPSAMASLQTILESVDDPALLIATADSIRVIAEHYFDIFNVHFRDTVDILVGWHIDATQSDETREYTRNFIVDLEVYWKADISFTLTLLSQFLEDIDSYSQDLVSFHSDSNSLSSTILDCLVKLAALVAVFNTVLIATGESISQDVPIDFIYNVVSKIHNVSTIVSNTFSYHPALVQCLECISHCTDSLPDDHVVSLSQSLVDNILEQVSILPMEDEHIELCFKLIIEIVSRCNTKLRMDVLNTLLTNNMIINGRYSTHSRVAIVSCDLYCVLLNIKDVDLMEAVYKFVLQSIVTSLNALLETTDSQTRCPKLVDSDKSMAMNIEPCKAMTNLAFDFSILKSITSNNWSIISLWALKPSLFVLFTEKLSCLHQDLGNYFPVVQRMILQVFQLHCDAHHHFVTTYFASQNPFSPGSSCPPVQPTTGSHFPALLKHLGDIVIFCQNDSLILVFNWFKGIIQEILRSDTSLFSMAEFEFVIASFSAVTTNNVKVIMAIIDAFSEIFSHSEKISSPSMVSCCKWLIPFIDHCDDGVRIAARLLLKGLSFDIVTTAIQEDVATIQLVSTFRHLISNKPFPGNFHSQNFRSVMQHILSSSDSIGVNSPEFSDIFYACQRIEDTDWSNEFQFRHGLISYWLLWNAALYCVSSKLRTPFGKPQETFTSIEIALRSLAKEVKQNKLQGVSRSIPHGAELDAELSKPVMLIMFLDNLEKIMYNAFEGCATSLAPLSKPIKTFFRTNKGTCHEWLNRIRLPAMCVSLSIGLHAATVRYGFELLSDMDVTDNIGTTEFEIALTMVVEALIKMKSPSTIMGLRSWCEKRRVPRRLAWLNAAALQAASHNEDALNIYKNCLKDKDEEFPQCGYLSKLERRTIYSESIPSSGFQLKNRNFEMGRRSIEFVVSQVNSIYLSLHKYSELKEFFKESNDASVDAIKDNVYSVNAKYLEDLTSFQSSDCISNGNLLRAHQDEMDIKYSGVLWNVNNIEQLAVENLLRVVSSYDPSDGLSAHVPSLEKIINIGNTLTDIFCIDWPPRLSENFIFHQECINILNGHTGQSIGNIGFSSKCHSVGHWNTVLKIQSGVLGDTSKEYKSTLLRIVHLSRIKENYMFAQTMACLLLGVSNDTNFVESLKILDTNSLGPVYRRQLIKLLYALGKPLDALEQISELARLQCCSGVLGQGEVVARSILTFVKWCQADPKMASNILRSTRLLDTNTGTNVKHLLEMESELFKKECGLSTALNPLPPLSGCPGVSETEATLGRLVHLACIQCPKLAKSWFNLGAWCYRWGRKAIDVAVSAGSVELTLSELDRVADLIPDGTTDDQRDQIIRILSQAHFSGIQDEDIVDQDQYPDMADTVHHQLSMVCPDAASSLACLWKNMSSRLFNYYRMAIRAYFKFLQINTNIAETEDSNVTATLRILRLLVKHAWELQSELEQGLAATPGNPWKGIVPQLFSRLNHPEGYVRRSISQLLCRVAIESPHLIVYPVVIGYSARDQLIVSKSKVPVLQTANLIAMQESEDDIMESLWSLSATEFEKDEEEEDIEDVQVAELESIYAGIADSLRSVNPSLVNDVQQFVKELQRITLLWNELCRATLQQHNSEVLKCLNSLDGDYERLENSSYLSTKEKEAILWEKYSALLKPVLLSLEQLLHITSRASDTPDEKEFQSIYLSRLNEALATLTHPPLKKPLQKAWAPFQQILHDLQDKALKKSSFHLNMSEISPNLLSMKNTVIPIPGQKPNCVNIIHLHSVMNEVIILPTKTKPKKLTFLGSDGKKYTFLFKGMEDLHLDERIMQLLAIINNMFIKAKKSDDNKYYACWYSVTPLGPRSGLIQWVDGATALFNLYKKWLQRLASYNPAANQSLRPSEIFQSAIMQALREAGLPETTSRKSWPLSVVRCAILRLMKDTPSDLIAKELWCSTTGPSEWWKILNNYIQSTAVMCMVGYIIGLGDRHLDNVLVDFQSGDVIHIDYNVCFDKGKTLRVPEKVPFRLTPNIVTALGINRIDGAFRDTCCSVLATLRQGKETLLTLLEAFVYDPLVDWQTSTEVGMASALCNYDRQQMPVISKRDLEKDVTKCLFAAKMAEISKPWLNNGSDLVSGMSLLQTSIGKLLTCFDLIEKFQKQIEDLNECYSYIDGACRDPRHHQFWNLKKRYSKYRAMMKTKENAMTNISSRIKTVSGWCSKYSVAIINCRNGKFGQIIAEVNNPPVMDLPVDNEVKEFLDTSGQSVLATNFLLSHNELLSSVSQQWIKLVTLADTLGKYSSISCMFSDDYTENTQSYWWKQWLELLANNFTTSTCVELQRKLEYPIAKHDSNKDTLLSVEKQLNHLISDISSKIIKTVERLKLIDEPANAGDMLIYVDEFIQNMSDNFCSENEISNNKVSTLITVLTMSLTQHIVMLTRKCLIMESSAAAASDRLVDLTSREGDWFLDELCSLTNNVTYMLMSVCERYKLETLSPDAKQVISLTMKIKDIYTSLQDLVLNSLLIIIPECIKGWCSGDKSVNALVDKIDDIVDNLPETLPNLMTGLETQLAKFIVGRNVDLSYSTIVSDLKVAFQGIVAAPGKAVTPGDMLMAGFNGLFIEAVNNLEYLIDGLVSIRVPNEWKLIDIVKDAFDLQGALTSDFGRELQQQILFVKKVQVIHATFLLCRVYANFLSGKLSGKKLLASFKHQGIQQVYGLAFPRPDAFSLDLVAKPIKSFVADTIRSLVIGLPSQIMSFCVLTLLDGIGVDVRAEVASLELGICVTLNIDDVFRGLSTNHLLDANKVKQCLLLLTKWDGAWKSVDLKTRLDNLIASQQTTLEQYKLHLSSMQWIHSESTGEAVKSNLLAELSKNSLSVKNMRLDLSAKIQKFHVLEGQVEQRLKWAAGANPTIKAILQNFVSFKTNVNKMMERFDSITNTLSDIGESLEHLETHRIAEDAVDNKFLELLDSFTESALDIEKYYSDEDQMMSAVELNLFTYILPLGQELKISKESASGYKTVVGKELSAISHKLVEQQTLLSRIREDGKTLLGNVKSVLGHHHKLLADVKGLLKTLSKHEEPPPGGIPIETTNLGVVHGFISKYRSYSLAISAMLRLTLQALSYENTVENRAELSKLSKSVIANTVTQTQDVYPGLVALAPPLSMTRSPVESGDRPRSYMEAATGAGVPRGLQTGNPASLSLAVSQEQTASLAGIPPVQSQPRAQLRDPKTGKAIQERNSYAINVWRKVKAKLDGKDVEVERKMSVEDQVAYTVAEATDMDNLALMYEGWTSWV